MAQARRGRGAREGGSAGGRFEFVGIGDRTPPRIKLELTGPKGETSTLEVSPAGDFNIDRGLVGKGYHLAIVPENGGESRYFTLDAFVKQLEQTGVFRVPPAVWEGWIWPFTCVTGHAQVCRPWFDVDPRLDFALLKSRLSITQEIFDAVIPFPWFRCFPVCNGKVEVFVRTCCCPIIDPPVVIRNICEIIDCSKLTLPPPIGPGPWPGPDPGPEFERVVVPALRRAAVTPGGPTPERVFTLAKDLFALGQMSRTDQVAYINARPDLIQLCCACSTRKVAEVPLQADGHFDACFFLGPIFPPFCSRRVIYRVSQLQSGSWVTVYDGFANAQSFDLGEDAALYASWTAQACEGDGPPVVTGPEPFVLLEEIGSTWAYQLVRATEQSGETTWTAPAATDGLVNPPQNQPWAKTLALRCQFHPGLEALGAKYYRVRIVPLSGGGTPFTITSSLSWLKYYDDGTGVGIESISLNNPVVNGITGLYTIPYPDPAWPWLGGQYHSYVDTASGTMPNGKYLFVVDIFNAGGQRLDPGGSLDAAGAGEIPNVAFQYRRMDPPPTPGSSIPTHVINHNALANLLLVDNTPCYGNIEAILENGLVSADNCQFLVGTSTSNLAIQYSAYQSEGFQDHHTLWVKKGLFGPTIQDDYGTGDVHSGDSPAQTFGTLLGSDSRCAFSATLAVICKHTNGSGHIYDYDSWDTVAFSLMT